MESQSIQIVDTMFMYIFLIATAGCVAFFGYTTATLSVNRDIESVKNSRIARIHVGAFFALMMIPTYFFYTHDMTRCSVATIVMALVLCGSLIRLSRRASLLLRRRGYI